MFRENARPTGVVGALVLPPMLGVSGRAVAQSNGDHAERVLRAVRADGDVAVDGRLDDAVWSRAARADGFIQHQPDPGSPATERTEVQVVYDNGVLYVGARMYDRDAAGIVARLARRDEEVYSDWIWVLIDSYRDRRSAFVFGVNSYASP